MYNNADLLTTMVPSITVIAAARQAADRPNFSERDQRRFLSILEALPAADPRLEGLIGIRNTALASYDTRLKYDEDPQAAAESYEVLSDAILSYVASHSTAPLYGVSVARVRWRYSSDWRPVLCEYFDPSDVEVDANLQPYLWDHERSRRVPLIDSPEETYIVDRVSKWAGGILRPIAVYESMIKEAIEEWRNLNKELKGLKVARVADSSDAEDQALAAEALKQLHSNSAAIVGQGVNFELTELAKAASAGSFDDFKRVLENSITIAILGQSEAAGLGNTTSGSRAAVEVVDMVRKDIIFQDMIRTTRRVQRGIVDQWWRRNRGESTPCPYQFEFATEQAQDPLVNAQIVRTVLDAGIPIKTSEVYARIGFTVPVEGDEVISPSRTSALL